MFKKIIIIFSISLTFASPQIVLADVIPKTYTNDNFFTAIHDEPNYFLQDDHGNFYGETLTGKYFTQHLITNSYNVRLYKFSIDEAFFYISDQGVIKAESDLVALSIYLMRIS